MISGRRSAADRVRRLLIFAAIPISLLMGWFLGVDWSWFVEECPDCVYQCSVTQYRVFGIPVTEDRRENRTPIQVTAEYLGAPCEHPRLERWHKYRFWGLCYCAAPCINGLMGFSYESDLGWLSERSETIREMGRADPMLGKEFRRRAIYGHDRDYWYRFTERLGAGKKEPVEALRP